MKKVLLVDDEENIREILKEQLESFGLSVEVAADGMIALNMVKNGYYDLVITDLLMPNMSGGDFVAELNRSFPKLNIIVITGKTIVDDLSLFYGNVLHFLSKPFTEEDLIQAMNEVSLFPSSSQKG